MFHDQELKYESCVHPKSSLFDNFNFFCDFQQIFLILPFNLHLNFSNNNNNNNTTQVQFYRK